MKKLVLAALLVAGFGAQAQVDADKAALIKSIYTEALGGQQGYEWLKYMCEEIGPRPSGSEAANEAARWASARDVKCRGRYGLASRGRGAKMV